MGSLEFGLVSAAKIIRKEFGDETLAIQVSGLSGISSQFVPRHKIIMSEDGIHCIDAFLHPNFKKT